MFVRWQLYRSQALDKQQRKRNDKQARLTAVLVESVRIGGKPCQKHIAFLGSTRIDSRNRLGFWYEVTTSLDSLGNRLTPQDRERIIAAITGRLGEQPPSSEEIEQFGHAREQVMASLARP